MHIGDKVQVISTFGEYVNARGKRFHIATIIDITKEFASLKFEDGSLLERCELHYLELINDNFILNGAL